MLSLRAACFSVATCRPFAMSLLWCKYLEQYYYSNDDVFLHMSEAYACCPRFEISGMYTVR